MYHTSLELALRPWLSSGKGLVSCHNPGHKDVPPSSTWYSGGYINSFTGFDSAAAANVSTPSKEMPWSRPADSQDSPISCGAYQSDACNCVYYARDRQPKLVGGLTTCDDKKNASNSGTPAAGCVLFRTGDPKYCHAAYITKVANGNIYYDQANWTPCACSSDSISTSSSAIVGFWCPK